VKVMLNCTARGPGARSLAKPADLQLWQRAGGESACKPGTVRIRRHRPLTCRFALFKIARAVAGPSRL
jgi:hypothetical protein